jgi:hypothetical protein
MNSPNNAFLAKRVLELMEEVKNLKDILVRYGDHTLECYSAPTHRCVCSWERTYRELGIRPKTVL